ncbi:Altered inheritance of mitochondria protein 24, mitochondrial [Candida viswanathii]|uniref:Altered inheritance of mitochondria protein 24, mitochondrial n=1 Tax=Candida viswanathii TaxID=5486 RepID=A0A367YCZ0_9ASCO|nr:Altered inheritance of mitochondria protein 24, mitochondrial [Candida viswanathii]
MSTKHVLKRLQRSFATSGVVRDNYISIDKPLVTGSGPFIELPKFKTVGDQSNLLQIIIPQSSSNLNIQINSSSIIGINGYATEGTDFVFKNKYIPGGLEFQELTTTGTDLNLLVQGNSYKLIELAKGGAPWTLLRDENLIGWIENYKLEFQPVEVLAKFKSLKIGGSGYVLINGVHDVLDFNLAPQEEILINPNSLIAISNSEGSPELSYQLIPHGIFDFKLPKLPNVSLPTHGILGNVFNPIKDFLRDIKNKYRTFVQSNRDVIYLNEYVTKAIEAVAKTYGYVYSKLFYTTDGAILRRNPIFLKVKGPARIIMNNSEVVNNNQVYTIKEIRRVV